MKSVFTSNQGVTEFFVALEGTRRNYFRAEMDALLRELDDELDGVKPIWIKFHVSDVVNQKKEIDDMMSDRWFRLPFIDLLAITISLCKSLTALSNNSVLPFSGLIDRKSVV